jgi:hypothetical protein
MEPRSDWARAVIAENVRKKLKERNLSKDKLNRISSPKLHRSTNKRFYFTPTESQTGVRLAGEALKFPPTATPRAKKPTRV